MITIDDLNGYYLYIYQLIKLFIVITIYGAFFIILFEYATFLFRFTYFTTISDSQAQLTQEQSKQ